MLRVQVAAPGTGEDAAWRYAGCRVRRCHHGSGCVGDIAGLRAVASLIPSVSRLFWGEKSLVQWCRPSRHAAFCRQRAGPARSP